jgi:hypothetical protein
MKLPSLKKILIEDLKGAPDWVRPMIDVLNSFMETVYQALNRNITFEENIGCFIKEITYKTPAAYPTMDPVYFQNDLRVRATGLQVLQVYDKSNYTPPVGPIYVPWIEANGRIAVYPITGLVAEKTYIVRLLIS